jgi:hypothetical protein
MAATAPRKAAPRKAAPRKSTGASVAARREVRAAKGTPAVVTFTLRGETFEIPTLRLGNDRTYNLTTAMQEAPDYGERMRFMGKLIRYLLGAAEQERWVALSRDDEAPGALVIDTLNAINKAENVPN